MTNISCFGSVSATELEMKAALSRSWKGRWMYLVQQRLHSRGLTWKSQS
jgi:hypothetical protein